jgi:DNA-binding MarR family transcriptional regulator
MSKNTNDNLLQQWRELESAHASVRESLERALEREHRLSLTEYEVLQRLSGHSDGQCRMQDLSSDSELSQSALSRLVGRLEAAGYVDRGVCDHDRRGVYATLTKAGREAQTTAEPTYIEILGTTLGSAGVAA